MNSILLHVCCANCACFTCKFLKEKDFDITLFWYNPNIHPYSEYQKRLSTAGYFATLQDIKIIYNTEYSINKFLHNLNYGFDFPARCVACWTLRLEETARTALKEGFSLFSTTLLYSIHQDHNLIREIGEKIAREYNLEFYYTDFRRGWQEGIEISKKLGLYRQKYCGCIFSEEERYTKKK